MIEANFELRTHKSAAIAGIYQYDTGQRLRMRGLPTPDELAEMDDFLTGDVATVQAQYGYAGDSQTETRIASYDGETGCWTADIPDVYLTRSSAVKVFVYVHPADGRHRCSAGNAHQLCGSVPVPCDRQPAVHAGPLEGAALGADRDSAYRAVHAHAA